MDQENLSRGNTNEVPQMGEMSRQDGQMRDPRNESYRQGSASQMDPRAQQAFAQQRGQRHQRPQQEQGGEGGIDFSQSTEGMILSVIRKISMGKKMPFTEQTLVDGQELIEELERARRFLPKEIKNAHWLIEHNQELLSNTRAEAENMLRNTQQQMAQMIDEHEITLQAQAEAEQMLTEASRKSREIHRQAIEYGAKMLAELEEQLTEMLVFIQKNKKELLP